MFGKKVLVFEGFSASIESLLPNHDFLSSIAVGSDGDYKGRDSNIARSLGKFRIYDLSGHYRPHPGLFLHHRGCSAAKR
jgi:hypothetical protein